MGQNEPSKHVCRGGSFPRKQPSRPMASSADNYRGAPDPSARHASEIFPITAADMQGEFRLLLPNEHGQMTARKLCNDAGTHFYQPNHVAT
jgi:hypothetical protein